MFTNPLLQRLAGLYGLVISLGDNLQSLFLLWMRLTWGHQFMMAGLSKLANMTETIQFFISHHIPYPHFSVYLVSYTELIGGILLMVGLASRLVSIPLIIAMVVAFGTEHATMLADFRFILEPSSLVHEAPYPFLITALLILLFGPGRISLDAWIKRWLVKQPTY